MDFTILFFPPMFSMKNLHSDKVPTVDLEYGGIVYYPDTYSRCTLLTVNAVYMYKKFGLSMVLPSL